jgi:uncharacterized RDD family membrane protein YckC
MRGNEMGTEATPTPQPTPAPSQPPVPPAPPQQTSDFGAPKASFLHRFIAWIIDVIIVGIIQSIITVIAGAPFIFSEFTYNPATMATQYALSSTVGLLVGIAYFVYFWGTTGQTPGKMAVGIKIIGKDGTFPIGYPMAFVRYIGYIISSIICMLGHLLILVDEDNQALHDKIAQTYVVKAS